MVKLTLNCCPGATVFGAFSATRGALSGETGGCTAVGVLCGAGAALALARLLAGFLYGVSATDPATYAAVAFALTSVAALASLLPARRAARVDPAISLRAE